MNTWVRTARNPSKKWKKFIFIIDPVKIKPLQERAGWRKWSHPFVSGVKRSEHHYVLFSVNVLELLVSERRWSECSADYLAARLHRWKSKDLFSRRWKAEVRPGRLQRLSPVMLRLKPTRTDRFKDICRPSGHRVAMAAVCCWRITELNSNNANTEWCSIVPRNRLFNRGSN